MVRFCLLFLVTPLLLAQSGHQRMIRVLQSVAANAEKDHPILGNARLLELRQELANLPEKPHPQKVYNLHRELGNNELRMNNLEQGIKHLAFALNIVEQINSRIKVKGIVMAEAAYPLAVAYMRLGETQNCCLANHAMSCILPIRGGGLHQKPEGSQQAIVYFEKVLEHAPKGSDLYLKARWLLNICYMTLNMYPGRVPGSYLIAPAVFQSTSEFPEFTNVAPALGLAQFDLAGSVVTEDFDNDGVLDVVVSSYDPTEQMRYFRRVDNKYQDRTAEAGLMGLLGGFNMVQADYDNDGFTDIFVLRGGWLGQRGRVPNSLLRNNGDGSFTDVTFEAGLAEVSYPTQTGGWADYDRDGDVDLFIGNEHAPGMEAPCQLFRNNGDGSFTDVALAAGVTNRRFTKAMIWGDVDQDGYPDLYLSNLKADNRLLHNRGDGSFEDITHKAGVARPFKSFPTWFFDYDNDGVLDLYVSSYDWDGGSLGSVVADRLGEVFSDELPRLYKGDGKGGFEDVSKAAGIEQMSLPMGVNFGDLDNDGYLDFYLGTGYPDYEALMPNVMFRNTGKGSFTEVTFAGGFGHLQKGHGVAFADLDNDGDQDIFEQVGGFLPGDKYGNALFENPGTKNNHLTLLLVGTKSNRSAIGTRIHIEVEEQGKSRQIYKWVNSGANFGANSLRQTVGIGKAKQVKTLEITWPLGLTQRFTDLAANRFLRITEGSDKVEDLF